MNRTKRKINSHLAWMISILMLFGSSAVPMEIAARQTMDGRDSLLQRSATPSDIDFDEEELEYDLATATNANIMMAQRLVGSIWEHWTATDFSFLNGAHGKGTRSQPYQIQTKAHLMALSQLASMGMTINEGDLDGDTYVGSYEDCCFELMANINLYGMEWIPIGFYQSEAEFNGAVPHPFRGHFNGNGYTISNFRISNHEWNYAGLFGAIEDSSIENLNVTISDTMTAGNQAGILAGYAGGQVQIRNCSVKGNIRGQGVVGGLVGYFKGEDKETSVIEDCNVNVTVDSQVADYGRIVSVGGIAGQADYAAIVDCEVETTNNATARIQGKGYVGGVVGWQNETDIYNVYVSSGTIGGNGAAAIGGITGYYIAGDIKVARMCAAIGSSGLGNYAHEGVFIGNKGSGCNFTYGTAKEDDLAYLFTDKEAKINAGICGSDVADDNIYPYNAHVGFWHAGDLYYTLKQGNHTKVMTEQYFYEELEQGILSIADYEINGEDVAYEVNHIAPDSTGRPKRGYLVSIPQIDTVANGTHFYDVAALTVTGSGAYYKPLDKEHRGAIADGTTVIIATTPKNTATEKYQLEGRPYYRKDGVITNATYRNGGEYSFLMPANDTEVSARYKRVAANIEVDPVAYAFRVVQTRTGSRKNPTLTTVVTGNNGNEIARYVNGVLDGAEVQPVYIQKKVDTNDDVADSRVLWSIDNPDLIRLLGNDDCDSMGYTDKSASIQVKLDSKFFADIIRSAERAQAETNYRYSIPATIYGAGHAGEGVAILTAATRNSESFEGKPCTAQSRIGVTFQILDNTYVDIEEMNLDQTDIELVVTRTLSGSRNSPKETITVTPPQNIEISFAPEFFSKKEIVWGIDDRSIADLKVEESLNQSADISAISNAKWIRDIIASDNAKKAENPSQKVSGNGIRKTKVNVKAEDMNGNCCYVESMITIRFETIDNTGGNSSSGGGGGGGSSSTGSKAVGTTTSATGSVPGSISGTWTQTEQLKWQFTANGRLYTDEWAYIYNPYAGEGQEKASWFRFDEQGHMLVGWHTEKDGFMYYLNPLSDSTKGRMLTGWQWIGDHCYYFNERNSGTIPTGALFKDTATPDGYTVNTEGAWVIDGRIQVRAIDGH